MTSLPDLSETFRQEARELLENLEQVLLDLGQSPDDRDMVDGAFRALHTLKGSGSMFGFDEVAAFIHEFETAFDRVRKGHASISAELVTVALSAKDHVHKLVEEPGVHASQGEPILAALRSIAGTGGDECTSAALQAKAGTPEAGSPEGGWHIRFYLPANAFVMGTNPLLLLEELRALGPCDVVALTDRLPPIEVMDPENCYLGWDVTLRAPCAPDAIDDVFLFLRDDMELHIEALVDDTLKVEADRPEASEGVPPSRDSTSAKSTSSLRVSAERLDELMDRVGELVIAQSRLSQFADASEDLNLKSIAEDIERLASGLRDTTMGIRMMPIGSLFGRFRRLAHDLSRDLGKQVEFVTSGEDTELDKTIIDRLADPLVHIIRNAIDHGLEPPAQRLAAGKPEGGAVRLSAVHSGAAVAISISDDGAGLNVERIRAKSIESGLIAADAKLADHELFQFLFHPGFSTAKEITAVSGRGVGMDVVKQAIEGLRGSIELSSTPGQGTTAALHLPLTLAIIEGMLVQVGDGRYAIPLSAVEECLELPETELVSSRGRNFLNVRGSLVPYMYLRELFGEAGEPGPHQKVVIISSGDIRVGLVVDQIIGNNQTVIKSLSKLHMGIETFSGATILGDGTVALILDVAHLVSFGQHFEHRLINEAGAAA